MSTKDRRPYESAPAAPLTQAILDASCDNLTNKLEMIAAAQRQGYVGESDDEADSYLIAKWFCKHQM